MIKIRQNLVKDKEEILKSQHQIVEKNIKGIYSDAMTQKLLTDLEMQQADIDLEIMKYRAPEDDVEDLVQFSLQFLENMDKVWIKSEPEVKYQFQKFVFFNGVTYDQGEFRTEYKPLSVQINESLKVENYPKMTLRSEMSNSVLDGIKSFLQLFSEMNFSLKNSQFGLNF